VLAATEDDDALELVDHLERTFPSYALRIEGAHGHLLSVSVHPDLDPDDVQAAIVDWLGSALRPDHEDLAVSPPCESVVGPLRWTSRD
jgi:hypothetical protein